MTEPLPIDDRREIALTSAVDLVDRLGLHLQPGVSAADTVANAVADALAAATAFYAWLTATVSLRLVADEVTDQTTGLPTGTPTSPGGTAMQIHDNEQFTLTAVTDDAKGFPTADALTWTVDDATVASLVVAADGQSCNIVGGNPGSCVVTVTDGTLTATEAVDVVAGDTALISLSEGPVTAQ